MTFSIIWSVCLYVLCWNIYTTYCFIYSLHILKHVLYAISLPLSTCWGHDIAKSMHFIFKNWFTTINNGVGLCFCVSSVSTFSENTKAIRKRRRYTSYRNNTLMEIWLHSFMPHLLLCKASILRLFLCISISYPKLQ